MVKDTLFENLTKPSGNTTDTDTRGGVGGIASVRVDVGNPSLQRD